MPKKETPEMLLTKHLGKVAAKALLGKIDEMIAQGESAARIEKLVHGEIAALIKEQLDKSMKIMIGQKKQPQKVKTGQKPPLHVKTWQKPPTHPKTGQKPPPHVKTGQKQPANVKTVAGPKSK